MGHHHHHHRYYNRLHRHLQLLPLLLLLSACSTVFVCAARGHGEGVVVFEPLLLGQESSPGGRGARLRDRERAGRPHSSSSSSSPGQESAGLDPQTLAAIWLFFSTGDRIHLADARCTKRFELSVPGAATRGSGGGGGAAGGGLTPAPDGAAEALAHYAHLLTAVLEQAGRERRDDATMQHARWYPALLSSLLESDPRVRRALLAFDGAGDFLQVNRGSARGDIVLRNVSSLPADQSAKAALAACPGGLKSQQQPPRGPRNQAGFAQGLREGRAAAARSRKGHAAAAERAHLVWSPPYLECEDGSYSPRWVQSLSACLQGPKDEQHALEFRGTLRLDLDLHGQEIDQCTEESAGWFAGTHRCHANSTQCVAVRGQGFRLGAYTCVCRTGFYRPRAHANDTGGGHGGGGFGTDGVGGVECAPCAEGCSTCTDGRPCLAVLLPALRLALLAAELLCALLVLASMAVVYRCRRSKVSRRNKVSRGNKNIRSSGLLLLEVLLFGSFLLCFPVIILYFEPGALQCMALRWVRLLGFSILYGTITLKLHRVLKVFLARTAQRLPYLTSGRVLRMLGLIMLLVLWFLTAWSAAAWENLGRGVLLVGVGQTAEGLRFTQCLLSRWDYMMALAEFLFLCWTTYLCYAVRTVPSAFHEPWHMTVAVLNEMLLSLIFHILQFVMTFTLHPDWMLLMVFIHTQLTVTVTVSLLLIPKFACSGATLRDDIAAEAYEDELDVMRRSGSYLNSSIASAWSEHSMDPEDLRDELKRLYAQLEVYKGQKMLSNNPHLQKKRSSKKGLGRSIMRRITELPENVVRQSSREERDRGGGGGGDGHGAGGSAGSAHGPHTPGSCKRVAIAAGTVATAGVAAAPSPTAEVAKGGRAEQQQQQRSSTATGTTNHKAFALPKSYSSYDHLLEQSEPSSASTSEKAEAEPLPGAGAGSGDVEASSPWDRSAAGSVLASGKEMSPDGEARGESESVDSAPLVCRSASAHNLSASDKRSPSSAVGKHHHHHHHHHHHNQHQHHHHSLKPSLLQKSLSLISGARERTAALSGKVGVSEAKTDEAKVATTPVVAAVSEALGRKDHAAQEETKTAKVPAAAATGMKRTVAVAAAAAAATNEAKERVKASSLKSRQEESPRPQSPQTHHPQRNSSEERHGVTFADNTPRPEEEYNREEVCPWEFQGMASTPPPPPDPLRPQKHVSIAPQKHTSIAGARYHSLDSTQFAGKLPEVGRHRAALAPVRHQSLTEVVSGGGGGDSVSGNGAAPETATVAETKAPPPPPASSPEDGTKKLSPTAEAIKPVPAQAVGALPQDKPVPAAPAVVAAVARADVCPWEVQPGEADEPTGAEAGDGSARKPAANLGDICPWELEAEIPSSSSGRAVHGLTVSPTAADAAATMTPEAPASDRSPGGGKSAADSAHELAGHPKPSAKSLGSAFKSLVSGGKKRDKGGAERPNHPGGPGNDRVRAAAAAAAAQGTAKPREGDRSKR